MQVALMKVEYKSTFDRVNNIIDNAVEVDREIDFIALDHAEWFAFIREAGPAYCIPNNKSPYELPVSGAQYRGITLKKGIPK